MGCGEVFSRTWILAGNFLVLLAGLALLIIGVLVKVKVKSIFDVLSEISVIRNVPILAIIIGVVIVVISFLGCCGAMQKNTYMLLSYGIIVMIIFLIQAALAIYVFVQVQNKDGLKTQPKELVDRFFEEYRNSPNRNNVTRELVDFLQQHFECCGTTGPFFWGLNNNDKPDSCYEDKNRDSHMFTSGCTDLVVEFARKNILYIGIALIVIAVFELLSSIFAFALRRCIQKEQAYY